VTARWRLTMATRSIRERRQLQTHDRRRCRAISLRSVTCHMGSHSVTCYPTQVNAPRLHPSLSGRYSHMASEATSSKILRLRRFKSDWDEIWQDCSSSKTHRLTESDFPFDVIVSRRRSWRHFTQKSAATWWVNTKRLPAPMQQRSVSSWSIVQ